jgi:hypothetical protein
MKVRLLLGDCLVRMEQMPDGTIQAVVCDPPYDLTSVSRGGSQRQAGTGPYGRHTLETKNPSKGFMGKSWDGTGIAFSPDFWEHIFRLLPAGGVVKAFGGTRTFHRMAAAMEEVGFTDVGLEAWGYGSGFPKSLDVSKAFDKMHGAVREMVKTPFTGNALMRAGGQNTRPWMEKALKQGYHEAPGKDPVSDDAKAWAGWGTALKPAWEPVLVAIKPGGPERPSMA